MLIEEYQPQSVQDIQEALKDLLGDTMEELLKAELDQHLHYEYGEKPLSLNTRNGPSKKTVRSSYGHIEYEAGIKSYPNYQPLPYIRIQVDTQNYLQTRKNGYEH